MREENFVKRLNKCSKESIATYLFHRYKNESALNEIELIEYNIKSKRLLDEMDQLNRESSKIKVIDLKSKMRFLKLHEEWAKKNDEIDKLNKWFTNRNKEVE